MRIAYQGVPGAFSEAAARRVDPDAQLVPCRSFDEVFEAVVKKRTTHGVVPLENSIGGTIHRNYDLLLEHELMINGEVELDVVHCLQALPGTARGPSTWTTTGAAVPTRRPCRRPSGSPAPGPA